jgi:hypothetical protein
MATINQIYTHPHVNVSVDALPRTTVIPAESTASVLFAPFVAERGSTELQKIYNLSQFINEYGTPDFETQGRTILNVLNWLENGGVVYGLRLVGEDAATPATGTKAIGSSSVTIQAKHPGLYYNSVSVRLVQSSYKSSTIDYIDVYVFFGSRLAQRYMKLSESNVVRVLEGSEYIGSFSFTGTFASLYTNLASSTLLNTNGVVSLSGGSNSSYDLDSLVKSFYHPISINLLNTDITVNGTTGYNILNLSGTNLKVLTVGDAVKITKTTAPFEVKEGTVASIGSNSIVVTTGENTLTIASGQTYNLSLSEKSSKIASGIDGVLHSKLDTPVDVIFDAGYSEGTKYAMNDFASYRDDITFIFDIFDFSDNIDGVKIALDEPTFVNRNTAVYEQKVIINDTLSGNDIWVTPTYFLSRLIAFNDSVYGLQFPTAGLSRGVLVGAKSINKNPTSTEKEEFYNDKFNYIEKDSRGFRFMSQLTRHPEEDALRFLNNLRSTNRMVRELENLGRRYLFEFNDATTLLNMSSALNTYIGEWIQNRTLSFGQVVVRKSTVSDEAVDVNLRIKFTGTIEVISIDITIE